jgi:hypothetical protein
MKVSGRCHCGQISFEAEIDPSQVRICHCTDCQTLTGTAFGTTLPSLPGTFVLRDGTGLSAQPLGINQGRDACSRLDLQIVGALLVALPATAPCPASSSRSRRCRALVQTWLEVWLTMRPRFTAGR